MYNFQFFQIHPQCPNSFSNVIFSPQVRINDYPQIFTTAFEMQYNIPTATAMAYVFRKFVVIKLWLYQSRTLEISASIESFNWTHVLQLYKIAISQQTC